MARLNGRSSISYLDPVAIRGSYESRSAALSIFRYNNFGTRARRYANVIRLRNGVAGRLYRRGYVNNYR
jgi:hypothetical protein